MSDFKARKKLLVAESEVYRELLKLEIRTFRAYGARTRQKLTSARTYMPWVLMSALPILTRLFGKKKKEGSSLKRLSALFFMGWKAYQQFAPLFGLGKTSRRKPEATENAAEEYLWKRL
jgi:hypothetical protein